MLGVHKVLQPYLDTYEKAVSNVSWVSLISCLILRYSARYSVRYSVHYQSHRGYWPMRLLSVVTTAGRVHIPDFSCFAVTRDLAQ